MDAYRQGHSKALQLHSSTHEFESSPRAIIKRSSRLLTGQVWKRSSRYAKKRRDATEIEANDIAV